jgi:hypothetical protein
MKITRLLTLQVLSIAFCGAQGLAQTNPAAKSFDTSRTNLGTRNLIATPEKQISKDRMANPENLESPRAAKGNSSKSINDEKESSKQNEVGTIGTGGGNVVASSRGVKSLDSDIAGRFLDVAALQRDYPEGFAFFKAEVEKVRKVMPSFAADIEKGLAEIRWEKTEQDQDKACLNDIGTVKIESGAKQLVLACQSPRNKVKLDMRLLRKMLNRDKSDFGVIFFHEVFISKMLAKSTNGSWTQEQYKQQERIFVTEIHPYILSTKDLNGNELYKAAATTGFTEDEGHHCNPYREESDPASQQFCEPFHQRLSQFKIDRDLAIQTFQKLYNLSKACYELKTDPNQDPRELSKEIHDLSMKATDLMAALGGSREDIWAEFTKAEDFSSLVQDLDTKTAYQQYEKAVYSNLPQHCLVRK